MTNQSPILVWLRQDLRLSDNPALYFAAKLKQPIILVYIYDPSQQEWSLGGASKWWLHQSLLAFTAKVKKWGLDLYLEKGEPLAILEKLVKKTKATAVYWNERYEPHFLQEDNKIEKHLNKQQISVHKFNASLLFAPWQYENQSGNPFKVFTPFWKKLQKALIRDVFPTPKTLIAYNIASKTLLKDFQLLPKHPWHKKLAEYWQPGEDSAKQKLKVFLRKHAQMYKTARDRPDLAATSKLSPHLHFGEISPVQIWHATQWVIAEQPELTSSLQHFLSELAWREFSYHLLHFFPDLPNSAFRSYFNQFSWQSNKKLLQQWQQGQTGYPIVDAGMRELWETGWMHNRVRMIVASFLTKHLLQPWQAGEKWFWDTLVDADLANNAASWQWVAGSGADAAPYFRIFNPVLQGQKFDIHGDYVKKWIPELKKLDLKYLHQPWLAPLELLQKADIQLGQTYPYPIVEHNEARQRALSIYKALEKKN